MTISQRPFFFCFSFSMNDIHSIHIKKVKNIKKNKSHTVCDKR